MIDRFLPAAFFPLLGVEVLDRLAALAENAAEMIPRPGAPRVLFIPGLPGTALGRRAFPLDDMVWFDPEAIRRGRLTELTFDPSRPGVQVLNTLAPFYMQMLFRLRIAGYDVATFPFDWRLSLEQLGPLLRERLRSEKGPVHIVAHSYGGLVARAAMLAGADNVGRVIMLGTPSQGTYATLQGIRGNHWVLRLLAALDPQHDVADLARVFASWPSIYDQLPARSPSEGIDFYNPGAWPTTGLQPRVDWMASAPAMHDRIMAVKGDFVVIAGHGYPTIERVAVEDAGFHYEGTTAGDGWVLANGACVDGVPAYFVEASHLAIADHPQVIEAVIDLLAGPTTTKLPTTFPAGVPIPFETDAAPAPPPFDGRRGEQLTRADVANAFAQMFNLPIATQA